MVFLIGILLTFIMLRLIPDTAFNGNRKLITLLMIFYSIIYFSILQYGLTINTQMVLHPFLIAPILIIYLTITKKFINQTLEFNDILKITLFIMGPTLLSALFEPNNNQFHMIDIFIIALIIVTTQSRFIKAPLIYKENIIEFYGLSIASDLLILYIFLGFRKINIDLFLIETIDVWILTLVLSLLSCLSASLIGLKFKYLSFHKKKMELEYFIILIIFNSFYVAISEEIIYRQLIFNYLRQFVGGDWISLVITTLLFGCAHISFGGKKMFVLSSIAGFFYGLIYVSTKNLLTAVIIHTITNIIWRSFFVLNYKENHSQKTANFEGTLT